MPQAVKYEAQKRRHNSRYEHEQPDVPTHQTHVGFATGGEGGEGGDEGGEGAALVSTQLERSSSGAVIVVAGDDNNEYASSIDETVEEYE